MKYYSSLTLIALSLTASADHYPFSLPTLPYGYDALEPYIDAETMAIHHQGHHAKYVDKLNKALESHPDLHLLTLDELLKTVNKLPKDIRQAVQNNAGGHANHSLFWQCMSPSGTQTPSKPLMKAINKSFGSFISFRNQFTQAAQTVFGSGWVWLCYNPSFFSIFSKKKLVIVTTTNQDSPLSQGLIPILGLDLWEHAYYLKYQNKRDNYIESWWNIVNWVFVDWNYTIATQG